MEGGGFVDGGAAQRSDLVFLAPHSEHAWHSGDCLHIYLRQKEAGSLDEPLIYLVFEAVYHKGMDFFKRYGGPITGVAIVVVVIIVGIVLTGDTQGPNQKNDGSANSSITSASMFQSVQSNTYIYALETVGWTFTPEEGGTQVRLKLIGFTRNNIPIDVATYRLGVHLGECSEMEMPAGLILPPLSQPLGFAQCEQIDSSRQFVVTQEGSNIVTRSRVLTQDSETAFAQIQSIDVTKIIQ